MRRFLSGLMTLLAVLFLAVAMMATWVHSTLIDTQGFVKLANEIFHDPTVQSTIVTKTSEQIMKLPQVKQTIDEVLPKELAPFEPTILSAVNSGVQQALTFVLKSSALNGAVNSALNGPVTTLHNQLVTGQDLKLNLLATVGLDNATGIVGQAASLLPKSLQSVTILKRSDAPALYAGVQALADAWLFAWFLTVVFFAGAIAVSTERRATIIWCSAASTVILVLMAGSLGPIVAFAAGSTQNAPVIAAVGGIVTAGLSSLLTKWIIVAAVLCALAIAWPYLVKAAKSVKAQYDARKQRTIETKAGEITVAEDADGKLVARDADGEIVADVVDGEIVARESASDKMKAALGDASDKLHEAAGSLKERLAGLHAETWLDAVGDFCARNLRMVRAGIVAVAALLLLIWPSKTFGAVIGFVALALILLALVEAVVSYARPEDASVVGGTALPSGGGLPEATGDDDEAFAKLERLAELHERKVLNDDEFAEAKAKVLAAIGSGDSA